MRVLNRNSDFYWWQCLLVCLNFVCLAVVTFNHRIEHQIAAICSTDVVADFSQVSASRRPPQFSGEARSTVKFVSIILTRSCVCGCAGTTSIAPSRWDITSSLEINVCSQYHRISWYSAPSWLTSISHPAFWRICTIKLLTAGSVLPEHTHRTIRTLLPVFLISVL